MIKSWQDYKYYLNSDRCALHRKGKRPWLFILDPIWTYQRLMRKYEYYINCKKSFIWKAYIKFLQFKFKTISRKLGFSIAINTIGPGLSIVHKGPIIIGSGVKIGANSRINIGVVIGENKGLSNSLDPPKMDRRTHEQASSSRTACHALMDHRRS